jgi:hypothetical protein
MCSEPESLPLSCRWGLRTYCPADSEICVWLQGRDYLLDELVVDAQGPAGRTFCAKKRRLQVRDSQHRCTSTAFEPIASVRACARALAATPHHFIPPVSRQICH